MKLSIIIPVYGVEKYIEDCIRSCIENISGNYSDVEIIVVDDGSKDHSIEIVHQLTEGLPNVYIISQKNQGLSMARNNGLDASHGDYVWFVDSDDIIAIGIINKILEIICRFEGVDIIELDYQYVEENATVSLLPRFTNSSINLDVKVKNGHDRFIEGFNTPVPFHVFRRSFLRNNSLKMFHGIYHEDSEFTPRAIWQAQYVLLLPGIAYYYRQRGNSIMTTPNPKKGCDYIFVAGRLHDFFEFQKPTDREYRKIASYISMIFTNGLHYALEANKEGRTKISEAASRNIRVLHDLKNADQYKYRILGLVSSCCPSKTSWFYRVMKSFCR